MIVEEVPAALTEERVDRVIAFMTGCTRSEASALVSRGDVRRNGRVVRKGSDRVAEGDVVEVDNTSLQAQLSVEPDDSVVVDVVFEDHDLVVVNKPAGLVVHPGAGTPEGTLVNGLVARYPGIVEVGAPERPGIVHRLDKDTSGLLAVARSDRALDSLSAQLSDRSVDRVYLAVVWGHLASSEGVIDASIGRSRRHRTKMTVVADGRDARTHYSVQSRAFEPAQVSVVECRLETGRTHQIRVHFQAIGHPVVGDVIYGGSRDSLSFGRQALHAGVLGFDHPASGERVRFEADPPEDLAALVASLS